VQQQEDSARGGGGKRSTLDQIQNSSVERGRSLWEGSNCGKRGEKWRFVDIKLALWGEKAGKFRSRRGDVSCRELDAADSSGALKRSLGGKVGKKRIRGGGVSKTGLALLQSPALSKRGNTLSAASGLRRSDREKEWKGAIPGPSSAKLSYSVTFVKRERETRLGEDFAYGSACQRMPFNGASRGHQVGKTRTVSKRGP